MSSFTHTDLSSTLSSCPDSPNCVHNSYEVSSDLDTLYTHTEQALQITGASSILRIEGGFDAVYTIPVFGWKDDVSIRFTKIDSSNTHFDIRSASREGYYDLGVNNRRVKKILKAIQTKLNN